MAVSPKTGFTVKDPVSGRTQDLGNRYVSKDMLLDMYPNIASALGGRVTPGLWVWGPNWLGQLGQNNTTFGYYSSPTQVGALTNWKQVSCGYQHTAAVKTDGTLWVWGSNANGALGLGTTTLAVYSSPVQVGALTTWRQVSCGYRSTFAVKTDGTAWSWGDAHFGQSGRGTTVNSSSPIQIGTLTNWRQIETGGLTTYAVKTTGTLWAWGAGSSGQLGNGTLLLYSSPIQVGSATNWRSVSGTSPSIGSGFYGNMAAIQDNGTLWACGYNGRGEVGNGVLGGTISTMVQVGSSTAWRQVMYTYYGAVDANAFGIQQDGSLWGWGFGLLSNIPGYTTDQPAPVQIGTETNWRQVGSSKSGLFAIKTDGTLWSWGSQFWGALGDSVYAGGGTNQSSPAQIGTLKTWKQLAWSGSNIGQHFAAIKDGYD